MSSTLASTINIQHTSEYEILWRQATNHQVWNMREMSEDGDVRVKLDNTDEDELWCGEEKSDSDWCDHMNSSDLKIWKMLMMTHDELTH